ncbi:ABC transporter ATP-binding protein [Streptomyces sp. GS7]|uniref:ABC transporter ATP-binding protein n=1 Tax=Streptomyces sp. GS7 TaxID=2692234 RepID=UPI0013196D05|nr:ABC transporter ATP-binding protein [Streptomyces sp. GS7]QHC25376.1 ATP-binding cassette domain-containing protein [Streptomyces sp. GS7]
MALTTHPTPRTDPADPAEPVQLSAVRSLLRLWPFVRPVRARLFTAAFVAVVASCIGVVIPLVLKWLVDGPVVTGDTGGVWWGGGFLLLLGLAEAGLFGLRRWLVARPTAGVEAAMREALYRRVQRLPVAFHDRWASGQLLSRATTDLTVLRLFLVFPLTFLVVNGTTIAVGCAILLAQRWSLGLVLLAPMLPLMVMCSVFQAKYAQAARRAQDQVGDLTTVVEESVLGIRIIKGFGRHRSQARAFKELTRSVRTTELRKARLLSVIWGFNTLLPELAVGTALVLGAVQVADGRLSAGTLVAFLSTALALRWPVGSIGFLLAMSSAAATAADRYFEVMDEPLPDDPAAPDRAVDRAVDGTAGRAAEGAADGDGPRAADVAGGGPADCAPPVGGLVFEAVEFRYPDAPPGTPATLRGVDLRIRPGETMALVGATGSGKTTLTALVPRLYDPTAGRITLDGRDLATLGRDEARAMVAVAFEEPTLFSATVAENVLMGASGTPDAKDAQHGQDGRHGQDGHGERDAPADRTGLATARRTDHHAALRRALEVAQADDFVAALPQGAATEVGEQGLSLSGGQRQRLALARAVVGRPRFLILDDPLSALDVHTEALVEAALRKVLAGTTALVVAHRPSTVLLADRVALLSGGRIAAVGTHHQLLRDSPEYAALMSGAAEPEDGGPARDGGPVTGAGRGTTRTDRSGPREGESAR